MVPARLLRQVRSADVDQRDRVALADVGEQRFQVNLLDPHLDVVLAVLPDADGVVVVASAVADVLDPALYKLLGVLAGHILDVIGSPRFVFSADIERQVARLAQVNEQLLDGGEVGLGRAVLLQDVAPAPRADLEI
jgi:hypothetical protein